MQGSHGATRPGQGGQERGVLSDHLEARRKQVGEEGMARLRGTLESGEKRRHYGIETEVRK